MKKIILSLFLLILPFFAQAQTCPFGLENDPAPGSCSSFIDENVNALCDLSEVPLGVSGSSYGGEVKEVEYISGEELKKNTVSEVAAMYGIDAKTYATKLAEFVKQDVKTSDSLTMLHDDYGLCSGVAGSIALNLKNESSLKVATETIAPVVLEKQGKNIYDLLPITLILVILYLFTYILVKENKISLLTHRRIWNIALLFSFLVSGLLGILLVIRINYGWNLNLPFNKLYIHVEAGIAMVVISIFHVIWHWQYYACLIKKSKKCDVINTK